MHYLDMLPESMHYCGFMGKLYMKAKDWANNKETSLSKLLSKFLMIQYVSRLLIEYLKS